MSVTQGLMTAEEFWLRYGSRSHVELVNGEVIEHMPPGGLHGVIAFEIVLRLGSWAKSGSHGKTGVESGFRLRRNPDVVRGPDVYFVRAERVPLEGIPPAFWEIAPDLAVEVVSPGESVEEVRAKIRDFLDAGTSIVWVVYPGTREVDVHTPDGLARTYRAGDVLADPNILPGFSCTIAELFE